MLGTPDAARPAEVVCSADSVHNWPTEEWVRLSSHLSRPAGTGRRWLSPTEVARLWRVATGSVYRLASEHEWTRQSRGGRVYYSADDVQRTFTARVGQLPAARHSGNRGEADITDTLVRRRERAADVEAPAVGVSP
jgi:hypothetical protein